MKESEVEQLKANSLWIVDRLCEAGHTFPPRIQAVLAFSGPGTYRDRIKPGQVERQRWMDRDRVRTAVAVVRNVTAARIYKQFGQHVPVSQINKDAIVSLGPWFVYNGTPVENEVLRQFLPKPSTLIPEEKTVIIDEVREPDGTSHPVRHTADQVKSLFESLADPDSPLFGITEIALVAHRSDFIRILNYTAKANSDYGRMFNLLRIELPRFHVVAIGNRPGTAGEHIYKELRGLEKYYLKGDLAFTPSPFTV